MCFRFLCDRVCLLTTLAFSFFYCWKARVTSVCAGGTYHGLLPLYLVCDKFLGRPRFVGWHGAPRRYWGTKIESGLKNAPGW